MCGIAGLISKKESVLDELTKKMTQIISHRGPDKEDFYFSKNLGLGHRRLSIIDLSDEACQPMSYLDRYTIVFNGEIYNFQELKNQLIANQYNFSTKSDTEVILAAYDFWGTECLHHFNGMWSFAIHDKKNNLLFCARDRFGVKPFYYYDIQDFFAFGSEIKQFTVLPEWKAELNYQTSYDFLSFSFSDHTHETFFKNVFQLQGSHFLIYDLNHHTYSIKKYYSINTTRKLAVNFEEAKKMFSDLLTSSVRYRLISDVKVGSCLSGGLDSSTIVMKVNEVLKEDQKDHLQETVSSCSHNKKFDESEYIDQVVEKTGCINHKVYPDFEKFWSEFDKIIWHQDEPFGSASIFAQWCVFEEAKKNNITVMLDGQGSDECLAGYYQFFGSYLLNDMVHFRLTDFLQKRIEIMEKHHFTDKDLFRFILSVSLSGPLYRLALKSGGKLTDQWCDKPELVNNTLSWKTINNSIENESFEEIFTSKLPILLHNEDRNSMAFSIESRVPFLDYRIVEFALSLFADFKIHKGETKHILRESMKGILPDSIINRHDKMAFVTPEEIWLKENAITIKKELEDLPKLTDGFVNREVVKYFDKMLKNEVRFDFTIFRFLSFARWIKVFQISFDK